jgi:hypothetical protein
MKKKVLYGLLLLIFSYSGNASIFAQCDDSITPGTNALISYRHRQNRCEGFYRAQVSGSLEVVGFIKGAFSYELSPSEEIQVIPETPEEINVRAVGIPMTLYYRLDARASGSNILVWKVGEVLYQASVPSHNIGIYGWVQKGANEIYLPVQTRATISQPQKDDKYRIYLRSPTKLSELRWRVCSPNSGCSQYQAYSRENIMAGQRIILELPQRLNGDYTLEIASMRHGMVDFDIDKIHFRI